MAKSLGGVLQAFVACMVTVANFANASTAGEAHYIEGGFYDGSAYRLLAPGERLAYVSGAVDGIFFSPTFGGDERKLRALSSCLGSMTNNQLLAIVDTYVGDHPAVRDHLMNEIEFNALADACRERGVPIY